MSSYLTVCENAARAGGQVLLDWQGRFSAREKGRHDLVTEADLASQKAIESVVLGAFPDHDFLGEEDSPEARADRANASQESGRSEYRWIVDPLDGTTNYVHQLHMYSVSVALERAGQIVVGAVFDPVSKECFTAEAGKGAFLNGRQLSTSHCNRLSDSLVAASFPPHVTRDSRDVALFLEVLTECQALRRLGSCALNLCYLAAGRLDGYWATSVKTWDVAAGVLIVREAGGIVTDVDGKRFDLQRASFATAANETLHHELLAVLSRVSC